MPPNGSGGYSTEHIKLSKVGLFSLKNIKTRGNLIAVYDYLIRGYQEDRVTISLEAHSSRKGSYKHEVECRKFQLVFLFFKYQSSLL